MLNTDKVGQGLTNVTGVERSQAEDGSVAPCAALNLLVTFPARAQQVAACGRPLDIDLLLASDRCASF